MRYNNITIKLCVYWCIFFMVDITLVGNQAVAKESCPGDAWLGKWEMKSMYTETSRVWDWWFVISRKGDDYTIETHTQSPAKILFINETKLEFDFNDELKTNIKVRYTGPNSAEGEVHQPNNTGLPHGRVAGTRSERMTVKSKAPATEAIGNDALAGDQSLGWVEYGTGDCTGHDVGTSEGFVPDDAKAQEGYTAICWDGDTYVNSNSPGKAFCAYKNVAPDKCLGGSNTGIMYSALVKNKDGATNQPVIEKIHFVEKANDVFVPIKKVKYNQSFYIEVDFSSEPDGGERTVTLDWGEGSGKEIVVKKQDDNSKIFRSDILYVKRPASPEKNN